MASGAQSWQVSRKAPRGVEPGVVSRTSCGRPVGVSVDVTGKLEAVALELGFSLNDEVVPSLHGTGVPVRGLTHGLAGSSTMANLSRVRSHRL